MSASTIALKAYAAALDNKQTLDKKIASSGWTHGEAKKDDHAFLRTLEDSLKQVNDLQQKKNAMVESFAAGENQNVHELMISLQKASLAMNMTSTVRNKILEAYKELMRMPF